MRWDTAGIFDWVEWFQKVHVHHLSSKENSSNLEVNFHEACGRKGPISNQMVKGEAAKTETFSLYDRLEPSSDIKVRHKILKSIYQFFNYAPRLYKCEDDGNVFYF